MTEQEFNTWVKSPEFQLISVTGKASFMPNIPFNCPYKEDTKEYNAFREGWDLARMTHKGYKI